MLARVFYRLFVYACLPLVFGYFGLRGLREPDYWRRWGERLGYGTVDKPAGLWLHAASVGEVQAALPLAQALAQRYPDLGLLVTVFTPTGRAQAVRALGTIAQVRYLPLDLPGAVERFLGRAAPRLAVIVETEIWPNLLAGCRRRRIPVVIANGRLSARSFRRYERWPLRPLIATALAAVARVGAASATDAERFSALGVSAGALTVTGNLKFDLALPETSISQGRALRRAWDAEQRPVWIAASTHAHEEEIVLDAFARLRQQHPDSLLLLVPRHPQRFDAVAALLEQRSLPSARHSKKQAVDAHTQVLLGDTMGELLDFYAAADVAFVGGSLVPDIGGHNLLEPAALRIPLVVGAHLDGWKAVADRLEAAGALTVVADTAALHTAVASYLADAAHRQRAGAAAAEVVDANRGALARTLCLIEPLIGATADDAE